MDPIVLATQETNNAFWQQTRYKTGQMLDGANPTDRAMMPVWLAIHYAVVSRDLDAASWGQKPRSFVQPLTERRQWLIQLFASDPTLDRRAQETMQSLRTGSR